MTTCVTANHTSDEHSIQKTITSFEEAWNKHDIDGLASLFTDDAEWVNIVGMWWRGKHAIKKAYQVYHQSMFKNTPLRANDTSIHFITADTAIAVVTWSKDGFVAPDGSQWPATRDRMSVFMVKRGELWLIAGGHNTTINEEAQQFDPLNG